MIIYYIYLMRKIILKGYGERGLVEKAKTILINSLRIYTKEKWELIGGRNYRRFLLNQLKVRCRNQKVKNYQ